MYFLSAKKEGHINLSGLVVRPIVGVVNEKTNLRHTFIGLKAEAFYASQDVTCPTDVKLESSDVSLINRLTQALFVLCFLFR